MKPEGETNLPAHPAADLPAQQSPAGGERAPDGAGISIADHPASA
jgi:hypothetical protein